MTEFQNILVLIGGFIIVAIASNQIAKFFYLIRLPYITGTLIIGIISGPYILGLIPVQSKVELHFINEIALAFIAFAASGELYLKELRSRAKSIKWMTLSQLIITFLLTGITVFYIADYIPFMQSLNIPTKIAIALLTGTIFVARSPASAIAVINELRARGPLTQTTLGVTVLIDFLVIILFSLTFSISIALVHNQSFDLVFIFVLLGELVASFAIGYALFWVLRLILKLRMHKYIKTTLILASGYSIYVLNDLIRDYSEQNFGKEFIIEPLLICIVGSFIITNYSRYRNEFMRIIHDTANPVYLVFFTLVGASISLDILANVWPLALALFALRVITMAIGSVIGGKLAGDPPLFNRIGWMPYITQAGVGLGLTTVVAQNFPEWGNSFATLIIAVIVISQIIGPPLFKWALLIVKEGHPRGSGSFEGVKDVIIFGLESQSIALARQLQEHGWIVKIATRMKDVNMEDYKGLDVRQIEDLSLETLEELDAGRVEAIVTMLQDDENLAICEMAYENFGTKDLIVRLNHRNNMEKFHSLGCLIVDPHTAMVSLMDHLVRSPQAASLLLGMEKDQDTMDLEVLNPNLHGIPLRDLRLPSDIIILSVKRHDQMIISHGYTRLRIGDTVTMVGSVESLDNVSLRFEK